MLILSLSREITFSTRKPENPMLLFFNSQFFRPVFLLPILNEFAAGRTITESQADFHKVWSLKSSSDRWNRGWVDTQTTIYYIVDHTGEDEDEDRCLWRPPPPTWQPTKRRENFLKSFLRS